MDGWGEGSIRKNGKADPVTPFEHSSEAALPGLFFNPVVGHSIG